MCLTVLIPMYNSEKYIIDTLLSLEYQTFKDFCVVICDDASTDLSVDVVDSFIQKSSLDITLIRNQINKGIAFTRNRLLDLVSTKYVAWIDSDDICYKYRFEKQITYLEHNDDIFACGGGRSIIDENGYLIKKEFLTHKIESNYTYIKLNSIYRNFFCNSTLMFRNTHHRMDESYPPAEDFEFSSRMILINDKKFINLPILLVKYRIHSSNTSSNQQRQYKLNQKIVSRNFDHIGLKSEELKEFSSSVLNPIYKLKHGLKGFLLFYRYIHFSKSSFYVKMFSIKEILYLILLSKIRSFKRAF